MANKYEMSAQSWGTLEELLLACAVNRHGTSSWDSIASDVKNQTSALPFLTPQHCIDKFNELRRRFTPRYDAKSADTTNLVPMLKELRRIRIEELRREVQQHDISILSLELKVKRLEEKREKSLKEDADMERESKPSLEKFVRISFAGRDFDDCSMLSFNEYYSSPKDEKILVSIKQKTGGNDTILVQDENVKLEPNLMEDKFETGLVQTGSKPIVKQDWSYNGNIGDDVNENKTMLREKISNSETKRRNQGCAEFEEPNELQKSVKQGMTEQSSDVQCSASLSGKKKKKHRKCSDLSTQGGSRGNEEPDDWDEVSFKTKQRLSISSELLAQLLEIIQLNRLGSVFERPTHRQESERYRNLIQQHMDLQIIQSRLESGDYSYCPLKFFRDLLLLFNNAIVFCRKSSREYVAAQELRAVVLKELNKFRWRQSLLGKTEPEREPASFSKISISSTMITCGKCSSLKTITTANGRKGNMKEGEVENKQKLNGLKIGGLFANTDDTGTRKKQIQDRSNSGFTSLRRSSRNIGLKYELGTNELSSHDSLDLKLDRRDRKERYGRGVPGFFNRMHYNFPGEETDNDDDDNNDDGYEDEDTDYEVEENKEHGRERNARRGRKTRSSRDRGVREETGRLKRYSRRALKTQEAGTPESLPFGTGRSGRNNGDSEVAGSRGRPRKRTRR